MMTATNTREEARKHLENKWGKGVVITLCYMLVEFVFGFISGLFDEESIMNSIISIAQFVVSVPISYGLIISFIKLKRGEEVNAFDFLKDGFDSFGKSWGIYFRMLLKVIVPTILSIISVFITIFGLGIVAGLSSGGFGVVVLGIILIFASSIYEFMVSLKYILSYYIAYDNPEMSCKEAVEESAKLMYKNRGNYFVLTLSFIGWAILAALTFGIGMLWLAPYMMVSYVCFYEELKGNSENTVQE